MYKKALEVLNKFTQNGYLAYIVGGYPRDTLLGIKTKDIDIEEENNHIPKIDWKGEKNG